MTVLYDDIYMKIDGWYDTPSSVDSNMLDLAIFAINDMRLEDLRKIAATAEKDVEILDKIMAAIDRRADKADAGSLERLKQIKGEYLTVFLNAYQRDQLLTGKSSYIAFCASFIFDSLKGASVIFFTAINNVVSSAFEGRKPEEERSVAGILMSVSSSIALLYFVLCLAKEGTVKYYNQRWTGQYVPSIKKIQELATLRLKGIEYIGKAQAIVSRSSAQDLANRLKVLELERGVAIDDIKGVLERIRTAPPAPVTGATRFELPSRHGKLKGQTTWKYQELSFGEEEIAAFDQVIAQSETGIPISVPKASGTPLTKRPVPPKDRLVTGSSGTQLVRRATDGARQGEIRPRTGTF